MHANAACVTANVWPPIAMLALRGAGLGLAATVKLIVCGPAPFAGTPVIHTGTPLLVQAQPAAVFTANELELAAADGLYPVGASEKPHPLL